MFSSFSIPFFGGRKSTQHAPPIPGTNYHASSTKLQPVKVHRIETESDKRSRTLKHLLKLNHANHSIIYNHLHFHNHCPHILGCSYILGGSSELLNKIYDSESSQLEPWKDSPGEISKDDWRDYRGKREYQRAYVDFFEDQLVQFGYDWKALLDHFLYEGEEPLINNLVSGLGHPMIHLGYAYEVDGRDVAIESLGLVSCFYDDLHKYLDDPSYTKPPPKSLPPTTSVLEIATRVAADERLTALDLDHQGADNVEAILFSHENVILEHWNSWDLATLMKSGDSSTALKECQIAAVALVCATSHPPAYPSSLRHTSPTAWNAGKEERGLYDFFLLHGLTTTHALRILLPIVPPKWHVSLLRQWLLFALLAYVGQLRPNVSLGRITEFDIKERGWEDFVQDRALNSSHAEDAHFVKGLRAMWVAEESWGKDVELSSTVTSESKIDGQNYWKKAAVKMGAEFTGWGGFDHRKTEGYRPH